MIGALPADGAESILMGGTFGTRRLRWFATGAVSVRE